MQSPGAKKSQVIEVATLVLILRGCSLAGMDSKMSSLLSADQGGAGEKGCLDLQGSKPLKDMG
jgi:hypothetical protein